MKAVKVAFALLRNLAKEHINYFLYDFRKCFKNVKVLSFAQYEISQLLVLFKKSSKIVFVKIEKSALIEAKSKNAFL